MAPLGIPAGDPNPLGAAAALRSFSSLISRSSATASSSILNAVGHIASVVRRQQQQGGTVVVSDTYQGIQPGQSPPPANVAGIVLGSVAGALLVLWGLYMCFNIRKKPARSSVEDIGVEVLQNQGGRRSHRHSHSTSNRRSVSREVVEVRSPPRRHRERERVRETVVVEERRSPRRDEEDIVEVIEEHSPPPRRHSSRRR